MAAGPPIRIVIPTSQIFLTDADIRKFDPWHQKTIYEYTPRAVPDSFVLPKPLFDFFNYSIRMRVLSRRRILSALSGRLAFVSLSPLLS
jgi:hypothetical protein